MESQQATTTQPATITAQPISMTSVLIPISYAIAAAILLAALGKFLRDLGKK
jgi:small-conductance mechanosensitive channel